jgi:hypothetical protein
MTKKEQKEYFFLDEVGWADTQDGSFCYDKGFLTAQHAKVKTFSTFMLTYFLKSSFCHYLLICNI